MCLAAADLLLTRATLTCLKRQLSWSRHAVGWSSGALVRRQAMARLCVPRAIHAASEPLPSCLSTPFSEQEIEQMISRCKFVLSLRCKCYGSRFTPWPSVDGEDMSRQAVGDRVAAARFTGIQDEQLDRLIRDILSRDDSLTSFQRAIQLMTAAFWNVSQSRVRGYLPWTMTVPPFEYQIRRFGQPLDHYVEFYRIFMNVIGFASEQDFDVSGIPKRIASYAKYRNAKRVKGAILSKARTETFDARQLEAMRSRALDLVQQEPERLVCRKPKHLWPEDLPLKERILTLSNPFGDKQLLRLIQSLLLRPDAMMSLQRSVRYMHEVFWSRSEVQQHYLPSTCRGLIRESQLGRQPLPHHETFYAIFMHLYGFQDADSFRETPEFVRVFKFTLHLTQWGRSSRLTRILEQRHPLPCDASSHQ